MFPSPRAALSWGLVLAGALIPLSLLWDFSWEATVGIDYVWAGPHLAGYLAVLAAALLAGWRLCMREAARLERLGAWMVLWGAVAFLTAFLFERWWQTSYGLAAGIWHPPQILKAVAFFAVIAGGWLAGERRAFLAGAGVLLAMIGVVTLASDFANRQHSAAFFQLACATSPLVLAAAATGSTKRFAATQAALIYTLLWGAMVWLLPLIPGQPIVAPIFHPRDHLLPPPFPLLLVAPALAMDLFLAKAQRELTRRPGWGDAVEAGGAFALCLLVVQWPFASFLLSPAADNRFFAGGGRHWPFFLQIDPAAMNAFWHTPVEALRPDRALVAALLAIVASYAGLQIGAWSKALRR